MGASRSRSAQLWQLRVPGGALCGPEPSMGGSAGSAASGELQLLPRWTCESVELGVGLGAAGEASPLAPPGLCLVGVYMGEPSVL